MKPDDLEPDLRQRWAEKWFLLALEGRQAAGKEQEANSLSGDQLARALGAKEVMSGGN